LQGIQGFEYHIFRSFSDENQAIFDVADSYVKPEPKNTQ
jgi:hypothetical protein